MLLLFSSEEGRAVFEEKFLHGMRSLGRTPANYGFVNGSDEIGIVFGCDDYEIVEVHRKNYRPSYVLRHVVVTRTEDGPVMRKAEPRRFDAADDALVAMILAIARGPLLDIFQMIERRYDHPAAEAA